MPTWQQTRRDPETWELRGKNGNVLAMVRYSTTNEHWVYAVGEYGVGMAPTKEQAGTDAVQHIRDRFRAEEHEV